MLADKLCRINGWDMAALPLHALDLGVRYRQINVVQSALASLSPMQQLPAGRLLARFADELQPTTDHEFAHSLLQIGTHPSPLWHFVPASRLMCVVWCVQA